MLSKWTLSTSTGLRLELLSHKKTSMIGITYMGCEFIPWSIREMMLTVSSRNDVMVAAICPEWYKLLDT